MHTYLLTLAYNGRNYAGWQRQEGFDTIQERLERAFAVVFGEAIAVEGAGRTDAGVHALAQCAHVRLPRAYDPGGLVPALNGNLPRDICVRGARAVAPDFHARFLASGKRYAYRCIVDRLRPVLGSEYFHWVKRPLDLPAMRSAARLVVGKHDFASFASNPGYERKRGTVRRVQHLHLVRRPRGLDLVIQGDGFLYNMVRTLAGTLLDVGLGRYPPQRVGEILEARDRRTAGPTAPAHALYLVRVLYPSSLLVPFRSGPDPGLRGSLPTGT